MYYISTHKYYLPCEQQQFQKENLISVTIQTKIKFTSWHLLKFIHLFSKIKDTVHTSFKYIMIRQHKHRWYIVLKKIIKRLRFDLMNNFVLVEIVAFNNQINTREKKINQGKLSSICGVEYAKCVTYKNNVSQNAIQYLDLNWAPLKVTRFMIFWIIKWE